MKALIVGATGLIGSHCLVELLNDTRYSSVETWVRNTTGIIHPKLIEKTINFDEISTITSTDADNVFCCLGTTINKAKTKEAFIKIDKQYVSELANLADKSGCQTFVVISSMGANPKSKNFYLRTKGEMEVAVSSYSFTSTYILRPSMLLGKRKEFRLAEIIGKKFMTIFQIVLLGKMKKYKAIQASTVAKAMLNVANRNEKGVFILQSDQIQIAGK